MNKYIKAGYFINAPKSKPKLTLTKKKKPQLILKKKPVANPKNRRNWA